MSTIAETQATAPSRPASRARWLFPCLLLAALVSLALNLSIGSMSIPAPDLLDLLAAGPGESSDSFIFWQIRLPRGLAALWGGACLAVAGLLLQVYFRNPIVDPFILGISSGATMVVALVMLTSIAMGLSSLGPYIITLGAFAGSLAAMMLVLAIARQVRQGVVLLIIGLMIGYLARSVTNLLVAFAEAERLKGFNLWTLGSFSGYRWQEVFLMMGLGTALLLGVYGLAKSLNAFLLGEDYARTMGVKVKTFRMLIIFFSCALSALVTSTAGPVAFIGLAVPHMARLSLGTSDNRLLMPAAALLGAVITGLCDLVARMLFSPIETPLSAVTSFFGAPMVIILLLKRRTRL
jgi:iron complex transport system permease protein